MNFNSIQGHFKWIRFSNQTDKNVTYIYVIDRDIHRLIGSSDILYVGKTEQSIAKRYKQETNTRNTPGNSQSTNIRLTHIFGSIGLRNCECYYTCQMHYALPQPVQNGFLKELETWDKKYYRQVKPETPNVRVNVPLEKYILVKYAVDHLELPPMNNSF